MLIFKLKNIKKFLIPPCFVLFLLLLAGCVDYGEHDRDYRLVIDAAGRELRIPEEINRVACSGAGSLRLLVYLQAEDLVAAVDSIEIRGAAVNVRPYALANPELSQHPLFGEFRGFDNAELILGLDPAPQVIFKTYASSGMDPEKLQNRTGVPVVVLNYGNLISGRNELNQSLRLMGEIVNRSIRAEEVIAYFDQLAIDLAERAAEFQNSDEAYRVYVGGIALRGPRGFNSTEPAYPPFAFLGVDNVAGSLPGADRELSHAVVAREQLLDWDPEVVFLDLATLSMGQGGGGLSELRNDPAYRELRAVGDNQVFGVIPYNSYGANFGSVFANAYFIGEVLYPDAFADLDPREKADEIYNFLVGEPLFEVVNQVLQEKAFTRLVVDDAE